jgi:putative membrane protein
MWFPFFAIVTFTTCLVLLSFASDNTSEFLNFSMDAHVVLGGALSFLVVFRTNSSYDRWWEARKTWQNVVNACRSHATSVASSLKSQQATEEVRCLRRHHTHAHTDVRTHAQGLTPCN